jgi:hypothetical protein
VPFISIFVRAILEARWPVLVCLITFLSTQVAIQRLSGADRQGSGQQIVINGVVRDAQGPIPGALVRLQSTKTFTKTDSAGFFTLPLASREDVVLTACAPGYYIGGGLEYHPGEPGIEIKLEPHSNTDDVDYEWVSAFSEMSKEKACQHCHAEPENPDSELPFDQWRDDAHSGSVYNTRFLTMYLGTDINGNLSPPTRYWNNRDYGTVPVGPNPRKPYYGPGYKLDFPSTKGNCATCHAPMAAIGDPYGVDPSLLTGVEAEGIGCDFCHKIWDVTLDPETGLPYENRPGVLSFVFRRPAPGHQLFTGPFDDVAPGEDVYSPIQSESQYCAPCHAARFWDVEIYNSYGEWLASPYSRSDSKTTCQDCHMPSELTDHFARFDAGGKRRDPETIFSHRMPGAADEELLQNAVTMTAAAELHKDSLTIRVKILNDRTGHHVPTDSPLRQMILIVRATNEQGAALVQRGGPKLPAWCGRGDPDEGYVAGLPGTVYAKVLEELWTGVFPSGAYWNQTRIRSDNRIAAFDTDETTYLFEAPADGEAIVDIRLLYRRAFIELRDKKGWDGEDIEMEQITITSGRNDRVRQDRAEPKQAGRNNE